MLAEPKLKILLDLVRSSTNEELIWMNGYLSGFVSNDVKKNGIEQAKAFVSKITIAYGTETGNSKRVAIDLAARAKKNGIYAKLVGLDQYRPDDLSKEEYFFTVISTQGEGEPPAPAKKFYDHIHKNGFRVDNLKYAVFALGDTAYPLYCKAGEDVDNQLKKLGAKQIVPLQKCDVDFETSAEEWFNQVLEVLKNEQVQNNPISTPAPVSNKKTGRKYYKGNVVTNINLNDRGSTKETYHLEMTSDETVEYEPGDSVAIIPANKKSIVETIMGLAGIDRSLIIETAKQTATVEELLTKHLNICYLLTSAIKKYAVITEQEIQGGRMDLVDLLRLYPVKNAGQFSEVIKILSTIAPRLYSIASSPIAHNGEIHITVNKKSFYVEEEQRYGLCSDFLGELPVGTEINFYIHRNRNFKLPATDRNIIMIGPGTGIAAFRSFLSERDASGANGKNWLFFGEQHFITDFLYQTEIQNYIQTGVLTKLSLAFSRDQPEKIYVQHKMIQEGKELFDWVESGASLYISGTKDPMSIDVENVLLNIIEQFGKKSTKEAAAYLEQLKNENRYQKDVY